MSLSTPPPYSNITGITKAIDNHANCTIGDYNGNAKPGELVVDLLTFDLYVGDDQGNLLLLTSGSGGDPAGGANTQIQFNNNGRLAGNSAFTFDVATSTVTVVGTLNTGLVGSDLIPAGNVTQSLGNATNQWRDLWISNNTIYLNSIPISLNSNTDLTVNGNPVVTADPGNGATNVNSLNVSGELGAQTATVSGNVVAGEFFIGDGAYISNINAANIVGAYSNANVSDYLPTFTGNLNAGNIFATDDIETAGYFRGNGAFITGLPASYGNSNLADIGSNAIGTTGNISAGYFIGDGSQLTGLPASYGNADLANIGANAIGTTGDITAGNITVTGNVAGQYLVGNGAFITGLPAAYSNTDAAAFLAAMGANSISSTGSVTAASIAGEGGNLSNIQWGNITGANTAVTNIMAPTIANINANVANTDANVANAEANITTLQSQVYSNANVANYLPVYNGNILSSNITMTGNIDANNINVQAFSRMNFAEGATIFSIPDGGLVGTTEVNGATDRGISVTAGGFVPGSSYAQLQWVQDITNYDPYSAANSITNWVYVQNDGIYLENIDNVNSPGYDYLWKFGIDGNLDVPGNISGVGNVDIGLNYFIGNGASLTGLPATYGNSDVADFLASGNLSTPIISSNSISVAGNVDADDMTIANTVTANLFIGNFQGNISGNLVVPGVNTWVLFNNSGNAGADAGFTYNKATQTVSVANIYTGPAMSLTGTMTAATATATVVSAGTGNIALTGNTLKAAADLITIDPVGDGSPGTGNVSILGNLSVTGNLTYVDVSSAITSNLQWIAANSAATAAAATGGGIAVGPAGASYATWLYNATANAWVSNIAIVTTGGANINGALTGATTGSFSNVVTAQKFSGNGALLTAITGANVTGQVPSAIVANTVADAAQPNITSLGTLTGLVVSGDSNVANLTANGTVAATSLTGLVANISTANIGIAVASYFVGDGSNISNIPAQTRLANGTSSVNIPVANGAVVITANGAVVGNFTDTAVALGSGSGATAQLANGIAIGINAGPLNQQTDAIAIGASAGISSQGANAVAIGHRAGGTNQHANSVAIGAGAETANSAIVLNATGSVLQGPLSGLYAKPVRNDVANIAESVMYNTTTGEVTYSNTIALAGNITGGNFNTSGLVSANGNVIGGNITTSGLMSANGNVIGGNITTVGEVSATGTITSAANVNANNVNATNSVTANVVAANIVSIVGNVTANNFIANSTITALGNVVGGNLITSGVATVAGNVTANNFIGNLANANTNISIMGADGNITMSVAGIGMASITTTRIGIGANAGLTNPGVNAVSFGINTGVTNQGANTVAVGSSAGESTQGIYAVAVGWEAGRLVQGAGATAVGRDAGASSQGAGATGIGSYAGFSAQGNNAIAVGYGAGHWNQGSQSIAMGSYAGNNQGIYSIAIGHQAANTQANYAVAIGASAAANLQGNSSVAIGNLAGANLQFANSIAIGMLAGANIQGANSIAIGTNAANNVQSDRAIAIGVQAGLTNQGNVTVAIGYQAAALSASVTANTVMFVGSTMSVLGPQVGNLRNTMLVTGNGIDANTHIVSTGISSMSNTSITGNILTVRGSVATGYLANNWVVTGNGVAAGTYVTNVIQANMANTSISGTTLIVGTVTGDPIRVGMYLNASGMSAGYYIINNISGTGDGSTWQLNASGTMSARTVYGRLWEVTPSQNTSNVAMTGTIYNMSVTQTANLANIVAYSGQGDNSIAIGYRAGATTQGVTTVAIGYRAGHTDQQEQSVAIGMDAGGNLQGTGTVAIGVSAGNTRQSQSAVAIGSSAGSNTQGVNSVAVGINAGSNTQGQNSVAVGVNSGLNSQGIQSVAVGLGAGQTTQATNSVAVGAYAGQTTQATGGVAIGYNAGTTSQGGSTVAVGLAAGQTSQASQSVAVGAYAGYSNQKTSTVAIGYFSGTYTQESGAVSVGMNSGRNLQQTNSIAIGQGSGYYNQWTTAVAIGASAGSDAQKAGAIAIGPSAGSTGTYATTNTGTISGNVFTVSGNLSNVSGTFVVGQTLYGSGVNANVTITGYGTGTGNVGTYFISSSTMTISANTQIYGYKSQEVNAIAIGNAAGYFNQGGNTIAIGFRAAHTSQGANSVVIGANSGNNAGNNSIAIGFAATANASAANSIVLNATGTVITANNAGLYINPVRNDTANTANVVTYNVSTRELTYSNTITVNSVVSSTNQPVAVITRSTAPANATVVGQVWDYDISTTSLTLANNTPVYFKNFSGSILVNDWGSSAQGGAVTQWLCGGASAAATGNSRANVAVGIMTYDSGNAGYIWTSNSGVSEAYSFYVVRTRNVA